MSMDGGGASSAGGAAAAGGADADLSAMTEEEQIAYAIQMSMADSAPAGEPESMEDGNNRGYVVLHLNCCIQIRSW